MERTRKADQMRKPSLGQDRGVVVSDGVAAADAERALAEMAAKYRDLPPAELSDALRVKLGCISTRQECKK